MRPSAALLASVASLHAVSCVVPSGSTPSVSYSLDAATAYVHRGMVQNENGVLQPEAIVTLPAEKGGTVIMRGWANMDLSNDTGDAWLPDGHAGKFSQIDFNLLYAQELEDNIVITSGLVSYNLPNGLEFPFGERGATTEFLVEGQIFLEEEQYLLAPFLRLHYDFDEVDGLYVKAGVERLFQIDDQWSINGVFGLGWMDGDQAAWNFAQPGDSGLADATLEARAAYVIDEHMTARAYLAYSTVVDSDFRDWFGELGIDPDQLFLGVGMSWAY